MTTAVQIARVKWLLTLAVQATNISGFTTQVIAQLAPAFVEVMGREGMVIIYQGDIDDQIRDMEDHIK